MKIVCQRESLLNGVTIASSVATSRTTRPILSGIKLIASQDGCAALATDLEIAVRARLVEVKVEREGEIVLTAHTLVEILRSIEGPEVTISSEGRHCEIHSIDADYTLVTDDPGEFPTIAESPQEGIMVPRLFLEELYQRTWFAAAKDVGRYALNGVLVELGRGIVRFVATDGRRLALAVRPLPGATGDRLRAIVPVKGLQECLKGSEGTTNVHVAIAEGSIVFSSDCSVVTVKPVEGDFPDFEAVIPVDYTGRLTVHRMALLAAVRKTAVFSGDEMRSVRIEIKDDALEVRAEVEGRGAARTRVKTGIEGSKELSVDFNPEYVADFLKPLHAETVRFEYREGNGAGVFRLDDCDDLYVVMPITAS